jgi:DNA-binding IclR family transcriptional regulator
MAQTSERNAESSKANTLLAALANEGCREILERLTEPKTAPELAQECDIPRSTIYRQIERLADVGLIEGSILVDPHGPNPAEYRLDFASVEISLDGEGTLSTGICESSGRDGASSR